MAIGRRNSSLSASTGAGLANSNSLPTITTLEQLLPAIKVWQQKLNTVLEKGRVLRPPFNLRASSVTGARAILLEWEVVPGADGYEISVSSNGDFSDEQVLQVQTSPLATSYVHSLSASGITQYYRVSATSGTVANPQSVIGAPSAPVSIASGHNGTVFSPLLQTVVKNVRNTFNRKILPDGN
jgi:hypothetical protein